MSADRQKARWFTQLGRPLNGLRQHGLTVACGALLALWGVGCANLEIDPDTLVVALDSAPHTLDPRFATSSDELAVSRLVFAQLVTVDNPALEVEGDLAESVEQLDPVTYEVTLRTGLRWHDGHAITTRDILYTFASIADPALRSPYRLSYARITSLDALDDLRVRIVIDKPHAPFITDLNIALVPEHILAPLGGHFDGDWIGSGPFRVSRFAAGHLELEANPTYHRGPPRTPRVKMRVLKDDNARLLALFGGSVDVAQNNVPPMLVERARALGELSVITGPAPAFTYLAMNLTDGTLADLRVRRAIAHALDREAIIRGRFKGYAVPSTGLLHPGHWAYSPLVDHYDHDLEAAKALLDAAGFPDPDGDGPATRMTLSLKTATSRFRRGVALAFAHQLAEVGIAVEVRSYEFGTFMGDIKKGNFQLYVLKLPYVVEPDMFTPLLHSSRIPNPDGTGGGLNRMRYRSMEMDRLIDAGRSETDRERRKAIYAEVQSLAARDLPVIPLWHEDNIAVVRKEVKDYVPLPTGSWVSLTRAYKIGAREGSLEEHKVTGAGDGAR